MKESIKNEIVSYKTDSISFNLNQNIAKKLVEINNFNVPESILKEQKNNIIASSTRYLNNLNKDEINKYIKENDNIFSDQALQNVKLFFIFEEIAKIENIEITDIDIDNEYKFISQKTKHPIETIKKYYSSDKLKDDLKFRIKENKVYKFLIENNDIIETESKK